MQLPDLFVKIFLEIVKPALEEAKEAAIVQAPGIGQEHPLQFLPLHVEDDEFHSIAAVIIGPGDESIIYDYKIIKAWSMARE